MPLTLGERSHWKDRIGRRVDRRIETLVAKQDPTLLETVAKKAREKAYESLGIQAQQQELDGIEKQKHEMESRERRLRAEQRAAIKGTRAEDELQYVPCYTRYDKTVDDAASARAKALEEGILEESELGRQVLALRRERENLLDTVWLATSPKQIKELWEEVNALLETSPTALEEKALKMEPVQNE